MFLTEFLANCLQIEKREGKLINIKMKMYPNMTLRTNMTSLFSYSTTSMLSDLVDYTPIKQKGTGQVTHFSSAT